MPLKLPAVNLFAIMPEISMTVLVCLVILVDLFVPQRRKALLGLLTLFGVIVTGLLTLPLIGMEASLFSDMYRVDSFAIFFKFIFLAITALTVLISLRYLSIEEIHLGEYYALVLFSVIGMMVMAGGSDLLTIYIGLELLSIPIYILVGFMKRDLLSQEGGVKYFLLGAFSSGIILYGIALAYGITGTTNLAAMHAAFGETTGPNILLTLSVIMIVAGFAFKIALVPFHMWAPDAYQGAPTSITAFMSVGTKAAAFAALLRIFAVAFEGIAGQWVILLWLLAVFSMTWGNIAAMVQPNLKRLLAYSSVAHAGYVMIGLVVGSEIGMASVLLYLAIYTFMNMGAFTMVILLCRQNFRGDQVEDFRGLARAHPLAGIGFLIFFLSLAGLPPTAGFVGKFYLFSAAIESGYIWLALIGVLNSVLSVYYYFKVVVNMYMAEPAGKVKISTSVPLRLALGLMVVGVILIGIYPDPLLSAVKASVAPFFQGASAIALVP
jgi:NADH-quinone oxidoreductase subunit N